MDVNEGKIVDKEQREYILVTQYIHQHFYDSDDDIVCMEQIQSLASFFEYTQYLPELDFCISLIQGNFVLSHILETIVDSHLSIIQNGNLESFMFSPIACFFIESYCMIHHIDIHVENLSLEEFSTCVESNELSDVNCDDSIGLYIHALSTSLLTKEQEKYLFYQFYHHDKEARTILIEKNLRLVVSLARKYLYKGLSFLDLIQYGNVGLIQAVDTFDLTLGYRFSTYAYCVIQNEMIRSIYKFSRLIPIPIRICERIYKANKISFELASFLDREISYEDIASKLSISVSEVQRLYGLSQQEVVSINCFVREENSLLEELIPTLGDTVEDTVLASSLPTVLMEFLRNCPLTEREREVLDYHYGLNGKVRMSQMQIADLYGLTKQRICQIEQDAFKKIRNSRYVKKLSVYTDYPDRALEYIDSCRENKNSCKLKKFVPNQK